MSSSTWDLIHHERRRLIEDLRPLTQQQWRTASLCPGWDVHHALAHVVALTKQTPPKFFGKFVVSGFKFDRMVAKDVAREASGTPDQTLAELTAHVDDTSAPPGPVDSWIGEVVVHGADIRRPLGIAYSPPVATTVQVADFYRNSNLLIGSKTRIAGVRLVATDTDFSSGTGPEVRGPILSLVLAMTGRAVALADLDGEGVRCSGRRCRLDDNHRMHRPGEQRTGPPGYSPVCPSTDSRSRSAWPLCRAYSSIR